MIGEIVMAVMLLGGGMSVDITNDIQEIRDVESSA